MDASITVEGKRHLGAAVGTSSFVESYVRHKVSGWVREVECISSIATTQLPHASYAVFTHSLASKWTNLARTTPDIEDPASTTSGRYQTAVSIPSLTGQVAFSDAERDLTALPIRLGGLGIINPSRQSTAHNNASMKIIYSPTCGPHPAAISHSPPEAKDKQLRARKNSHTLISGNIHREGRLKLALYLAKL